MRNEILNRARIIRNATPNCLSELYEMSNHICDLCGCYIQDRIFAVIEHSVPVSRFARNLDLSIEDAVLQAHNSNNLRCAHSSCNHIKGDKTREEWFLLGLNKKIGEPKKMTNEELALFRFRLGAGGRVGGLVGGKKAVESGQIIKAGINTRFSKGCLTGATFESRSRGGIVSGLKNVLSGHIQALGRKNVENGHIQILKQKNIERGFFSSERQSKASSLVSPLNRLKGLHSRWHVKRNIVKENCDFCILDSKNG